MKLAVCIPVYEVDVSTLLQQMHAEIRDGNLPVEICLIDDHSSTPIKEKNRKEKALCSVYKELEKNIGRSAIRNKFLEFTQAEYLLFVDCDILPVSTDFIKTYLRHLNESPVICGGHLYSENPPGLSERLKWQVGKTRESRNPETRKKCGWKSFMPSNFCIERKSFEEIKFDENLSGYGHEDTLFAYRLLESKKAILHINNPVRITDTESNQQFLVKTEQGVKNLAYVAKMVNNATEFENGIRLIKFYIKLKTSGLLPIFGLLFSIFEKALRKLLLKGNLPLYFFDLYKLGLFAKARKELRS